MLIGAEGGKIMLSQEHICRGAHGVQIQRGGKEVKILALEDVGLLAVPYTVDVGLLPAVEPRVKARRGFRQRQRSDILREMFS